MARLAFASLTLLIVLRPAAAQLPAPIPTAHTERDIEGWTVHIDDRLLDGPDKKVGDHALRILSNRLYDIQHVVPAEKTKLLRKVHIWIDLSHGKLKPAQYHPSAGWLKSNGFSETLAKCVHIPVAAEFASVNHQRVQPWSTLHELAHAYHDQVFGFDDPRIRKVYEAYKKSGHGDAAMLYDGRLVKHYALTNQMEFFAEMSEAYFGANDFFPFNRAELKIAEPEIYGLMESVWGPPFKGRGVEKADVSTQYGTRRLDFAVGDRRAFILLPTKPADDGTRPWIWYAPTFIGGLPDPSHEWLFTRLLASGFAIVGIDVGESYGNPKGREAYNALHKLVVDKYALTPKACLLPQSRGGLMLYNWAVEHPQSVQCIGGIYTVCDMASWPGLAKSCGAYGMSEEELRQHLAEYNPIDRLEPLAKAKVSILHLHGRADTVVPLEKNSEELARRYRKLGGEMELIIIDGKGHEVCPEFFQSKRLLEFFRSRGAIAPGQDR